MLKKKNNRYSIFIKLMLLFLVFILLANFSIGFILSRIIGKGPPQGSPERFPVPVQKYIISRIGDPPDTNLARRVSDELQVNFRIESSGISWTNDESIPDIPRLREEKDFRSDGQNFIVRLRGRPIIVNKTDDGYIIFSPFMPRDLINETNVVIAVVLIITILAVMLYLALSWIFGPIKKLSEGVEMISEGNFDNTIIVNRKDELGNLAASINEMKENISSMIKSKESLLIDVSHELRSPLTRIKLANEFIDDPKIHNKIRDDVKEMELMITELLETYRMDHEQGKFSIEKADIVKLIKDVISKFEFKDIQFSSQFAEKEIFIDRRKIETVFRNIIDNAVKYSEGRKVAVDIYERDENRDSVFVSVKDKGRGIEEEELGKIFEPFYRIDKSRDKKIRGYGLGLSLVKKILEGHNAEIEVKSRKNEGTEFIVTFKKGITNK